MCHRSSKSKILLTYCYKISKFRLIPNHLIVLILSWHSFHFRHNLICSQFLCINLRQFHKHTQKKNKNRAVKNLLVGRQSNILLSNFKIPSDTKTLHYFDFGLAHYKRAQAPPIFDTTWFAFNFCTWKFKLKMTNVFLRKFSSLPSKSFTMPKF